MIGPPNSRHPFLCLIKLLYATVELVLTKIRYKAQLSIRRVNQAEDRIVVSSSTRRRTPASLSDCLSIAFSTNFEATSSSSLRTNSRPQGYLRAAEHRELPLAYSLPSPHLIHLRAKRDNFSVHKGQSHNVIRDRGHGARILRCSSLAHRLTFRHPSKREQTGPWAAGILSSSKWYHDPFPLFQCLNTAMLVKRHPCRVPAKI